MQKFSKILIDGNNLFYRNYFVKKDKNIKIEEEKIESGAIEGFLKSVNKIEKEFATNETEFYFLWDNMSSKINIRKSIDPDYKIDRKIFSKDFYRSIDYTILTILNHSNNYNSLQDPMMEADDLPPALIKSFSKRDKVLVCSEDLDWSRNINDNVYWYSHNQIYNKELFKEKYGFSPTSNKICLYKSFRGDSSDNIEIGVKGISEKIILQLIEDCSDIYDLFDKIHSFDYLGKWKDDIIKNKSRLILNYQLVDFIESDFNLIKENIHKGKYNINTLRSLYNSLNLKISEIDTRLMMKFPEKNELESFFVFKKIDRV